jgi:hypothetical protein
MVVAATQEVDTEESSRSAQAKSLLDPISRNKDSICL